MAKLHVEAIFERLPVSFQVNLLRNCLSAHPDLRASFSSPIYKMTQRCLVGHYKGLKWPCAWIRLPLQGPQITPHSTPGPFPL